MSSNELLERLILNNYLASSDTDELLILLCFKDQLLVELGLPFSIGEMAMSLRNILIFPLLSFSN